MAKTLRDFPFVVDKRDHAGTTLLMEAARQGELDCLKECLARGAKLNAVDYAGRNALMYAIEGKQEAIAAWLLNAGIDAQTPDKAGNTPLHHACMEKIPEVVERLAQKKVPFDVQNKKGVTALMFSCAGGDGWAACRLVDAGADATSITNQNGATAFALARQVMIDKDFEAFKRCVENQQEKKRRAAVAAAEAKEQELAQNIHDATVLQRNVTPMKPVAFRRKAP
jgi:ankyrin repeat protein